MLPYFSFSTDRTKKAREKYALDHGLSGYKNQFKLA